MLHAYKIALNNAPDSHLLTIGNDVLIETRDMTRARYSWFNIWDRAFSTEELEGLVCSDEGNVVNWGTHQTAGKVLMEEGTLFPCAGEIKINIPVSCVVKLKA